MGAGPVEVAAVLTEVGRRLAPEPILDAVLVPGGLIADAGSAEQRQRVLPGVAEGTTLLAFAHQEPGIALAARRRVHQRPNATREGWTLTGRKNPVRHGDCAD